MATRTSAKIAADGFAVFHRDHAWCRSEGPELVSQQAVGVRDVWQQHRLPKSHGLHISQTLPVALGGTDCSLLLFDIAA